MVVVGGGNLGKCFSGIAQRVLKENASTETAVFPGGSEKRKSNNDDKHGHGQEKRRR